MSDDMKRESVRLKDIARKAGVSSATVSYALAGAKGVSAATRRRVRQVADKLGYVPNRQAAALRGQRSLILGVSVTDIRNPFFTEIITGLESAAIVQGYRPMLCVTADNPEAERRHLQMLLEHRVDGLILVPVTRAEDGSYRNLDLLRTFKRRRTPIMCIVNSIQELDTGRITSAVYAGTRLLMEHLIELGHRDIAYFSLPLHPAEKVCRHTAYQDALREAGIPVRPELVVETGLTATDAYERTGRLLEQGVRFTAATYASDYMAVGGLRMLRERNIRVPEDVSVTGFDDIEWAQFCEVPLTTANYPKRRLGEMAVRELVEHLNSDRREEQPACDIALRPTLVVRKSTGVAPV